MTVLSPSPDDSNPSHTSTVECLIDPDCRDDQICHEFSCIDPCLVDNPCAVNAICSARAHTAQCRCPEGLNGDPYVLCRRDECRVNRDCKYYETKSTLE